MCTVYIYGMVWYGMAWYGMVCSMYQCMKYYEIIKLSNVINNLLHNPQPPAG